MAVSTGIPDKEKIQNLNAGLLEKGYQLVYENHQLCLHSINQNYSPLVIDFVTGKSRHRRLYGGGSNQPLAKAVGIKPGYRPNVFDLTAGLGRDAFVLATLGCQVSMFERSAVIACLLDFALNQAARADDIEDVGNIVGRMRLTESDSREFLVNLKPEDLPDVIYLDPMYPHRDKSAQVKKEMRIFRDLVGDDSDASDLLNISRQKTIKRVVVKRPKGAEVLGHSRPDFQVSSKNTRYDCYLPLN